MPRKHNILDLDLGGFHDYLRWYEVAKDKLANGQKDAGLRILFAVHNHISQLSTEDKNIGWLKKLVESTCATWGEGFDWD